MLSTLILLTALGQPPNVTVNVYVTPSPPVRMGWTDETGRWYPTWAEADAWNGYYYQVRVAAWSNRQVNDAMAGIFSNFLAATPIPGRDYYNTRSTVFSRGHRVPIR